MKQEVIAIFDIGKTNKKFLLFNKQLELLHQEEQVFEEITDEDGFPCDDIIKLVYWITDTVQKIIKEDNFDIQYLNFTTYGASLVYLDNEGENFTPLYNYLKPMPDGTLNGFYEKYGGKDEFSRATASPALDMLNSGLQIYWLKKHKPELYRKVKHILHLPQFLSYLFTGYKISGFPSIGCHTAMWDFDNMKYHPWLQDEGIDLPEPIPSDALYYTNINGKTIKVGVGIHDSSASLVPYFRKFANQKFVLISTGTWAINMNPFNTSPLTANELKQDCLCFLSVQQKQVKSSRLFLGHIHQVNAELITNKYKIEMSELHSLKVDEALISKIKDQDNAVFFPNGLPTDYLAEEKSLENLPDAKTAYHQFMYELTKLEANALDLIFNTNNDSQSIFITGGFVKNDIFCRMLATILPDKKIYKAELYNATALGTAMIINHEISIDDIKIDLELVAKIDS